MALTIRAAAILLTALAAGAQDRAANWSKDLDYFASAVRANHPNPFTKMSDEDFQSAIAQLKISAGQLEDYEIAGGIAAITARLGDGHTSLNFQPFFTTYPLRFRALPAGFYTLNTGPASAAALGKKLVAIDGHPIDEAYRMIKSVLPYENEHWASVLACQGFVIAEYLRYTGITSSLTQATFEFEGGLTLTLRPGPVTSTFPRDARPQLPLFRQNSNLNYWFDYLPDSGTLFIKYLSCVEDPALPSDAFAAQLAGFFQDRPLNRVVLDIRDNAGGATSVTDRLLAPFTNGTLTPSAGFFAIIRRDTYSSAMIAAAQLHNLGWTLVGEAIGGSPNSFGNRVTFTMPNSGWVFGVSNKVFQMAGYTGQNTVAPDIPVEFTIEDYANNRDPYLAAALAR